MRASWTHLVGAAVIALGCAKTETVNPTDVVTLESCPDGGECQTIADGASLITFAACVPDGVTTIASSLTVTLRASSGAWQNPPDKTQPAVYTAVISGNRCITPTLVTPTDTLELRVDASLAGFQVSKTVALTAAQLGSVELTAVPAFLTAGQTNQIVVHAVVRATGTGAPTTGTIVSFAATATPAAVHAEMWPASVRIDQSAQAQSTLVIAPPVTSATIAVTATGPATAGGSAPSQATASITIASPPPKDGGAADGP